ncbi:serine hydrolase [Singulisphaera sp. Ch08]|uniref:Serine hydrolase n=1 Tax=Singulisphaera sp. Ch08 TaxID=3120278 RepID=A0AAU7C7K2_9BACT
MAFARIDLSGSLGAIAFLAFLASFAAADEISLESRLLPLLQAHKGKVSVAIKNLETGESFLYHEDVPMPTASLIKLPIMVESYRQAEERKVDLGEMITLKQSDKVPGSGILTDHFSVGAKFPLLDAIHLMIVYSDNTATNLVLDKIGIGSTAATMEKLGYPNTKAHSKVFRRDTSVFPERSEKFGLGSSTAAEMIRLCESLHKGELVSKDASEAMLKHLRACDDKDKFPRFLPPGTKVAFKTGSVDASKTAAGIIECGQGPVAVCVMTDENEDKRWVTDNAGNRLCAEVARVVFEHYKQEKDDARAPK